MEDPAKEKANPTAFGARTLDPTSIALGEI